MLLAPDYLLQNSSCLLLSTWLPRSSHETEARLDAAFDIIFVVELLMRIWLHRSLWHFFNEVGHWFELPGCKHITWLAPAEANRCAIRACGLCSHRPQPGVHASCEQAWKPFTTCRGPCAAGGQWPAGAAHLSTLQGTLGWVLRWAGRFHFVFTCFHIFHNQILPPAVSPAWQATCQPPSSMQLALDTMSAAVGVKKVKSMTNSI